MHLVGFLKLRALIVTLVAVAASAPTTPAPVTPAPTTPALEMVGLSPAQAALVTHVVDLYADADLELPPVVVRLGTGIPRCDERPAFHQYVDGRSQIHLCYPKISGREFRVLAHELAHAWAKTGLTSQRRLAFQALRGWEHWLDYELARWRENGTEQAAEIIKWGVSDITVPVFVDHDSCAELREGYRVLTGAEPPHGRTELCDPRTDGPPAPQPRERVPMWS